MRTTRDAPRKRDTELDLAWTLLLAYWPIVRYSFAFCSVIALVFGPPGSFLLIFGLLVFLSWKVAHTDPDKLH